MSTNNQLHQVKKATANTKQQRSPSQAHLTRQIHPATIIQRARAAPESLRSADVQQLQRTIGNRAVGRLLTEIGRIPPTGRQAPVQRQPDPDEEELMQGKFDPIQLQGELEDEELLQGKFDAIQQQGPEEEELLQGKFTGECIQYQVPEKEEELMQAKFASGLTDTLQANEEAPPNRTGMPDNLKSGLENISGMNLSGVRVQYNSSKPKQLKALAYTRGQEIHVGPSQEKHLPHEGWHVVQQMQGRVEMTSRYDGVALNDNPTLEAEADRMGAAAVRMDGQEGFPFQRTKGTSGAGAIQRRLGVEAELSVPVTRAPVGAVNADDRIRAFLGGGVWYDTQLAATVNNYTKKADHGPIGTVIENARQQMDVRAQHYGHAAIPQLHGATKPAIMEYVTDPFPVNTRVQRNLLRNRITGMANNITPVHAAAGVGVVPIAHGGLNFLVGLPPVADFQAFAIANGMAAGVGTTIHANILANINDRLYVQMTMGVQLRRMPNFMKKLRKSPHLASQAGLGDPHHAQLLRLVTQYAAVDAKRVVSGLALLPRDVRRSKSLRGYTTLLMAYIFGSYVYRQVDIAKNMVAALSKTPLHIVQQELDVTKRPDQWLAPQRAAYQAAIIARAIHRLQQPMFQAYWPVGNHNARLLGNWQADWLPNVLNGASDTFAGTAAHPGQLIIGAAPADDHTIAPEDDPGSKAIVAGPGRPVGRAAPNPAVSGVIPMELRFIEDRPQPDQLLALVNRGIALIRSRGVR